MHSIIQPAARTSHVFTMVKAAISCKLSTSRCSASSSSLSEKPVPPPGRFEGLGSGLVEPLRPWLFLARRSAGEMGRAHLRPLASVPSSSSAWVPWTEPSCASSDATFSRGPTKFDSVSESGREALGHHRTRACAWSVRSGQLALCCSEIFGKKTLIVKSNL